MIDSPTIIKKTNILPALRLASLLIAVLWATATFASGARMKKPAFYARYERLSTQQLMTKAKDFYARRNQPDSALVCYTVVANRLVDGTLPKSEYRQCVWAMMQLSTIYLFTYNEWDKSDDYLTGALKLAEDNNFHDLLPYIYGNQSIIDYTSDVVNHKPNGGANYLSRERKVFYMAIKEKKWDVVATSFYNMAIYTISENDVSGISSEVRRFGELRIPRSVEMYRESMLFYKVCLAYLNRNYNQCISLLESYKPGRDAFLKPAVEQMVLSDIVLLYNKTHQPEKALQLIERLDKEAASSHNTVKKYSAYGLIADYWKQRGDSMKAEHYDYLKLKTKEKLNEDNNLNKMKENRFLNEISQINSSLKAETAKKRLVTLFLILAGIALTVIAVLLILQVRAARAQKRYVDLLYRRNQQLLANNQLLVAVDHPEPEEPSRQKPVELPAGIVEAIERVMARRRSSAATPSPCRRSASSRASTATTFRRPSATNTTPTSRGCSTATASRRPAVAWPPPNTTASPSKPSPRSWATPRARISRRCSRRWWACRPRNTSAASSKSKLLPTEIHGVHSHVSLHPMWV